MEKTTLLKKISQFTLGAGVALTLSQPVQAADFNVVTSYSPNGIITRVHNNSGKTVNQLRACTQIEDSSKVTSAGFVGLWNGTKVMADWDGDGTDEVCYDFTQGLGDPFTHGDVADVTFTTSPDLNPQAIDLANGETNANFRLQGLTIDQTVPVPSVDMHSSITASVDANTSITGPDIDSTATTPDLEGSVYWGDTKQYTVAPKANNTLTGAPTGCDSLTGNNTAGYTCTVNGDGDTTIAATSQPLFNQLSITTTSATSDTASGAYPEGVTKVITGTCNAGHDSLAYSGCDSESNGSCTVNMDNTENVNISCIPIVVEQFQLITVGNHARVTPSGTTSHGANTSVSVSAVCDDGYHNLTFSGCDTDNPCIVNMTGNKTVIAQCSEIVAETVLLTVIPSPHGIVEGEGVKCGFKDGEMHELCTVTLPYGSNYTLTATPKKGFAFGGFVYPHIDIANPLTLTMNKSLSIASIFTKDFPWNLFLVSILSAQKSE